MNYRLSHLAEADIEHIDREGVRLFGALQASRYISDLESAMVQVAAFLRVARERETPAGMMRMQPYGAHRIVYQIDEGIVLILRIRQGREDWNSSG